MECDCKIARSLFCTDTYTFTMTLQKHPLSFFFRCAAWLHGDTYRAVCHHSPFHTQEKKYGCERCSDFCFYLIPTKPRTHPHP